MPRIKGKSLGDFLAQVIGVLSKELGLGLVLGIRNECCRLGVGVRNKWYGIRVYRDKE